MTTKYERVASLVSGIRNARFGEMVKLSEELIESEAWRDFTTPSGVHFEFRRCEYDYFLAAMEADATTMRLAYVHAGTGRQQIRLADITGAGKKPKRNERRDREEVANLYATAGTGASGRIRDWKGSLVTDRLGEAARNGRRAAVAAGKVSTARPAERVWRVRWSDGIGTAEAIARKLLAEPDTAHEVYKILHAAESARRYEQKRRSEATSVPMRGRADRNN